MPLPQVPAPSSWADGMAPEKVLKALEDMQHNTPNTDAEAMRFAISVSELQPDTGACAQHQAHMDSRSSCGSNTVVQTHTLRMTAPLV